MMSGVGLAMANRNEECNDFLNSNEYTLENSQKNFQLG